MMSHAVTLFLQLICSNKSFSEKKKNISKNKPFTTPRPVLIVQCCNLFLRKKIFSHIWKWWGRFYPLVTPEVERQFRADTWLLIRRYRQRHRYQPVLTGNVIGKERNVNHIICLSKQKIYWNMTWKVNLEFLFIDSNIW